MSKLWTKCWICDNSNEINLSSTKTDIDLDIIDSNLILIKTLQSQLMEKSDIILK
jgi:hypothetical protein